MRASRAAAILLAFAAVAPASRAVADTTTPCNAGFFELADRPTIVGTPCTVNLDSVVFETGYYQNASRVGGTALAAYPTARLRSGVAREVELYVDAPSEIAKSGLRGQGIYTTEQAGYGAKWTIGASPRLSYGLHAEITPPNLATSIMDAKERYEIGAESLVWAGPRLQLGLSVDLDDGRRFGRQAASDLAVREGLSVAYSLANATRLTTEFATEDGSHHSRAAAHSMGDVIVQRALSKRALFDVELGTSFNTIRGGSKPHYLGSGLAFRT